MRCPTIAQTNAEPPGSPRTLADNLGQRDETQSRDTKRKTECLRVVEAFRIAGFESRPPRQTL